MSKEETRVKLAMVIAAQYDDWGRGDLYVEEADAILKEFVVIPREDLPNVEERNGELFLTGEHPTVMLSPRTSADEYYHRAYLALAAARYVEQHPPLDEAAVARFKEFLSANGQSAADLSKGWTYVARKFVEAGFRAPATEESE